MMSFVILNEIKRKKLAFVNFRFLYNFDPPTPRVGGGKFFFSAISSKVLPLTPKSKNTIQTDINNHLLSKMSKKVVKMVKIANFGVQHVNLAIVPQFRLNFFFA